MAGFPRCARGWRRRRFRPGCTCRRVGWRRSCSDARAALYLWHIGHLCAAAAAAVAGAGYTVRSALVWNKNHAQFGLLGAQYKVKHESLFYCFKRGKPVRSVRAGERGHRVGLRSGTDKRLPSDTKPVELGIRALTNSSAAGELVLDLFAGSGSTLIACEQIGRVARLVELVPSYCQVIIDRWEAFTGAKAAALEPAPAASSRSRRPRRRHAWSETDTDRAADLARESRQAPD